MSFTEDELLIILASFIWPFIRIGSMFISIPVFSVRALPAKIRVIISLLMTFVVMPMLPNMPDIALFSHLGFMVTVQQVAIGVMTGFILQMVFAVMLVAGQSVAFSMGLGFASMVDPTTGVQVPVVAQLFIVSTSLMFLAVNGHLLVIEMIVESFHTLPVAVAGLNVNDLWSVITWSSRIFSFGVLIALPVTASLLFVNMSFGVAAKAAPQLQIFGIGFPITIMLGMVLIGIYLSNMLDIFSMVLADGFRLVSQVLRQ